MSDFGIDKLINISSDPIGSTITSSMCPSDWSGLQKELFDLLCQKNGFFAFESALLVRPFIFGGKPTSLEKWNEVQLWKDCYKFELPELFFFAEDIFGGQFAILQNKIVTFDPETGEIEKVSESINAWAKEVLSDYDFFTGHSLASQWQKIHGPIPSGHRLIPKQLFVLGGEFNCDNLMLVEEVKSMRSRGFFATELVDVPDGGQISFELVD